MIWLHGRTANKELDPGRYLRWIRAGIAACAIDLPGHGERFEAGRQEAAGTLSVVRQALSEIDKIVDSLASMQRFDLSRMGIGGASAGGMAVLARLCKPHPFRCASVEATTGSWLHQRQRPMFAGLTEGQINELNPIANLQEWREIPFQAIHARHDEMVSFDGQAAFVEALRSRYGDKNRVTMAVYDRTGAPQEHIGFGRMASIAKDAQRDFLKQHLGGD